MDLCGFAAKISSNAWLGQFASDKSINTHLVGDFPLLFQDSAKQSIFLPAKK
jgi:hypothetical protein